MTTLKYARKGYRFYRVETPNVFVEFELPDGDDLTEKEALELGRLHELAEMHQTSILVSPYRCG